MKTFDNWHTTLYTYYNKHICHWRLYIWLESNQPGRWWLGWWAQHQHCQALCVWNRSNVTMRILNLNVYSTVHYDVKFPGSFRLWLCMVTALQKLSNVNHWISGHKSTKDDSLVQFNGSDLICKYGMCF